MSAGPGSQRGVSLIEALVALTVMAFGVLGVVGLQTTLRNNADVSRQRGEAVRIAQARIEANRAYPAVSAASGPSFDQILSAPAQLMAAESATSNTQYTLYQTVTDAATGRAKTLVVRVDWRDRTSQTDNQSVAFGTLVARVPPELAGSLALPGDASLLGTPSFRNPAIPLLAVPTVGEPARSSFNIPGTEITWVFDNLSGRIVSTCSTAGGCAPANARLLSGYVRYATGLGRAPAPADGESPPGPFDETPLPAFAAGLGYVRVVRSDDADEVSCLYSRPGTVKHVVYYCAVPVTAEQPGWSGTANVYPRQLATTTPDTTTATDHYRVCRYAPVQNPTRNIDHPARYTNVTGPLVNQNFLIIQAGNGTTAFACPADDPDTPLNSATWLHQPPPPPA